jgi:serine/threonine-protein kinase
MATSVADLLMQRGMLPADQAVRIAGTLLGQLDALHKSGRICGTIESRSVLVGADGSATIGTPAGSPFLAPEQELHGQATARADVYAVGMLIFEMLTGSAERLRLPVAGAPRWLSDIVERATRSSEHERYASAGEMREALGRAVVSAPASSPAPLISAEPAGDNSETMESEPVQAPLAPSPAPPAYAPSSPVPLRVSASPGAAQVGVMTPPPTARRRNTSAMPAAKRSSPMIYLAAGGVALAGIVFIVIAVVFAAKSPVTPGGGTPVKIPDPGGSSGSPVTGGGGSNVPVKCGYCNGDGRIDPDDQARDMPRTAAALGRCPYCQK